MIYKFQCDGCEVEMEGEDHLDASQKMRIQGINFYAKEIEIGQDVHGSMRQTRANIVLMTAQEFWDAYGVK